MNVSLQNIDKVSAELTVKLEKADYQEKVDKELKSLRQKAQIPGFRKGMVPTSLIKKMYGKSVIAEVVNKALQEAVYNYIKDNKVNMLGEPLPNEEKQQNIDFDTMEEFDFVFDIALAPEFKAEVSAKDKVDYYSIEVSEEMIDNQVKMYTQRTGKYDKVDAYEDNDMLKGLLAQLDEEGNTKEGGIQVEAAVLMPAYMKNDDQKLDFGECLNHLLDEKGVKMSELYMRNAVGKSFTYYIRNGEKRPSKKTVIKVAFALNATVEETNLLLKSSGNKELYPRQEEDSIIEFGLRNHMDVYQVEELLKKRGSKLSLLDKEKNKK